MRYPTNAQSAAQRRGSVPPAPCKSSAYRRPVFARSQLASDAHRSGPTATLPAVARRACQSWPRLRATARLGLSSGPRRAVCQRRGESLTEHEGDPMRGSGPEFLGVSHEMSDIPR
jgi:hypothetical protein